MIVVFPDHTRYLLWINVLGNKHVFPVVSRLFRSKSLLTTAVTFLPVRPASQMHDSHKGCVISIHESPAGRIKNCGKKSAFYICNLCFECLFFYLRTMS